MTEKKLLPRSLGEALRLLMVRGDLTAEKLSEAAGVSRTALSAYLSDDREPSASKLFRIVDTLARRNNYRTEELLSEVNALLASLQTNHRALENAPAEWVTPTIWAGIASLGQQVDWVPCGECGAHALVRVPLTLVGNSPELLVELQRLCRSEHLDASVRVEGNDLIREVWPEGSHSTPPSMLQPDLRMVVPDGQND